MFENIFKYFILTCVLYQVKAKLPLIFPPTAPTRTQWIVGIGIPLEDLPYEAMTSGYVLKAEYFLPDDISQLKIRKPLKFASRKLSGPTKFEQFLVADDEIKSNATTRRKTSKIGQHNKHILTSYRWTVYKGLEGLANRMGLSGHECVLKSICEAAENPFHFYNGLFGELLHILLTPSSSTDALSTHSDNEYYHAESMGRSGAKCEQVFKNCPRSLLHNFSSFQTLSENIMSVMG